MTGRDGEGTACPLPLRDHPCIVAGHGGGGALSRDLLELVFRPAFSNPLLDRLGDSAVLDPPSGPAAGDRLALSTDSYVVRPLFFPGGSIGDLAVNGTVNDLAMSGARPLGLTAGFILEEGLAIGTLVDVVGRMAAAARAAGVRIVAGDTKVVERGRGDGIYVNTAGLGVVPAGCRVGAEPVRPGDVVVASGTLGDHGMAIMSVRAGLAFEAEIASDTAPLHGLVEAMLAACPAIRLLRDPTRGGAAATLNEMAGLAGATIEIDEGSIPVDAAVAAACEILGLDPLEVASEGRLLAIVPEEGADAILAAMRTHDHGRRATAIGRVVGGGAARVVMRTALGARRIVPMPLGELLPRIC